jgi:hypothetical protein
MHTNKTESTKHSDRKQDDRVYNISKWKKVGIVANNQKFGLSHIK